jgi:amino-acid N-acetyltransferase
MHNNPVIKQLHSDELDQIRNLLLAENLPTEDLTIAPLLVYGMEVNGQLLAIGALENYGTYALLRSVAVAKNNQKQGIGKQLVTFLENQARKLNIEGLYLLTTTADRYFRQLKYHEIKREDFPMELQSSAEFSHLCPASAFCLFKKL